MNIVTSAFISESTKYKMSNDLLEDKRIDPVTKEVIMYGSKENWLIQPVPVLKLLKAR